MAWCWGPCSGIMSKRNLVPEQYGTLFRLARSTAKGAGAVNDSDEGAERAAQSKRKDARRNKETLLDAAAAVFVTSGVEAPVRDIAAKAGVGLGTIYRHFP